MKGKSKFLCGVLLSLLLVSLSAGLVTAAEDFAITAESAVLLDSDTGQVLYAKNAHQRLAPASLTKIMTLLVTMDVIDDGQASLNDKVTISRYAESMGGSQIFLAAGEQVTLENLLEAVAIASANDASVAVAEFVAGTESNFVQKMNEKAEELGLKDTHFVNSNGLPTEGNNHYSSAYDIAVMSRALITKHPRVLEWTKIWVDYLQLRDRKAMMVNTNSLVNKYPGLDGLKTGHTTEAGFCLSATAERSGFRLISVVFKTASEEARNDNTIKLLDYGFRAFERTVIVKEGDEVPDIPVKNGKALTVKGQMGETFHGVILKGTRNEVTQEIRVREGLEAPIKKGDELGQVVIKQGDRVLGYVPIRASEDVERANIFVRIWRAIIAWLRGLFA
ncbi:MAG: D-alanyl-D-alanine carboxypeptidase family protein [Halanaerobium sp.]|nr:D-alanyl-D-alanine carboxypeptidase family protein [Halanaerobium sp.]